MTPAAIAVFRSAPWGDDATRDRACAVLAGIADEAVTQAFRRKHAVECLLYAAHISKLSALTWHAGLLASGDESRMEEASGVMENLAAAVDRRRVTMAAMCVCRITSQDVTEHAQGTVFYARSCAVPSIAMSFVFHDLTGVWL